MPPSRDPVERAADESADLYDVATWEPRSVVDHLSYGLYGAINYGLQFIVLLVALIITLLLLVPPALLVAEEPFISGFFLLSVVPALGLAAYIWYSDITTNEPLGLLIATFILAILFATFAAVVNDIGGSILRPIPFVGTILFFFLIVGPIEEAVKLLAVRVLAYRSRSFDAVIDGAVYGAVAGLGFAAIENAVYITRFVGDIGDVGLVTAATGIATVRALVGPGHVLYSAIAGYYLGLAKFNPQYAGPLIVKGLFVAAIFHAMYNSTVQIAPTAIATTTGLGEGLSFVIYVIGFNLLIGYYLYRKIKRYRTTYQTVGANQRSLDPDSELTEFDPAASRRER